MGISRKSLQLIFPLLMNDTHQPHTFIAPNAADLAPLFPNYEMQGLIASGGMGAVYCAVQKSLDRTVALKILPVEFSADAAFCAGFEAEAKAMARLNHPNLVGVFEFGEVEGMLYIIMEFVPGKSIFHSAHGTAIDQSRVLQLVTRICDGLAHAHENGIIHRDIKPSNILLDLNAQPKIGDFGLARPADREMEEGEEIFGTPHYTAPEVVNDPHSVDHRADIFSVGVMLHELLTGKLPADDPRPASMIARCDIRFDSIIKRATQPLPSARYASVAEMGRELQGITDSLAQKSAKGGALPRRVQPVRGRVVVKRKSSSSPVLLLLLAAVLLGAAYYYFKPRVRPPSPQAIIAEPAKKEVVKAAPVEAPVIPVVKPAEAPAVTETPEPEKLDDEAPVAAELPKADVSAFFVRARKIMQDRTKTVVSAYRGNLLFNLSDLERSLVIQLRKPRMADDMQQKAVTATLAEWRAGGGGIPESLDSSIDSIAGLATVMESSRKRQTGIEDTLSQALVPHSAVYILGLEKEIERLKAKADPAAAELVMAEIENTKKSPEYFMNLMLGKEMSSDE
jgi:serine/threonine protein kinase